MLKDITLGQYIPGDSLIHRLDPRIKIIAEILFIVTVFLCHGPVSFGIAVIFNLVLIFLAQINIRTVLKSLKPVMFLVIFTALINLFLTSGETSLFEFGFLSVTKEGVVSALTMAVRIILLVSYTSLLTFTTSPILLTDGIESLLKPFSKIGMPAHELAMMMTIALRFIPTLMDETNKIIMAQKSRGADFENGSLVKRAGALIPILVPLFINSFKRADELATAMECRCYRGGENRTRLKELRYTSADTIAFIAVILLCAAIITFGVYGI